MAKDKIANYTPVKGAGASAAGASPMKTSSKARPGKSPPRKGSKNKIDNKLETSINNSKFSGLATVVEMMMDYNCPANLHVTDGLGADNMTCVIIEFNK